MDVTVSTATIVCMAISCLIGFAIPIGFYIFFRKTVNADTAPFFIGCGTFLIFALVLESGLHQFILGTAFGATIRNNTLYYAVYGGLCAAVFEEFGRLIACKTLMRDYTKKDANALMYGAGHGGLEAMLLLGLTMINNISYATTINEGKLEQFTANMTPEVLASFQAIIDQLTTSPPWYFLLGGLERIIAVVLQIALSILVWIAVTRKNKFYLFLLAMFIHFFVDAAVVLLTQNGMSMILVELCFALFTAITAFFTWKQWQANVG